MSLSSQHRDATARALAHEPTLADAYAGVIRPALEKAASNLVAHHRVLTAAPTPDEILSQLELAASLEAAGEHVRAQAIRDAMEQLLRDSGITFSADNPLVAAITEQSAKRAPVMAAGLREQLIDLITEATQQGQSVTEVAAMIRAEAPSMSQVAAQAMARTEMNAIANAGSLAGATLAGAAPYKQWLSSRDDRVRPSHAIADGQVVALEASFAVGGQYLQYPGDPNGTAAEIANCRCTLVYADTPRGAT